MDEKGGTSYSLRKNGPKWNILKDSDISLV